MYSRYKSPAKQLRFRAQSDFADLPLRFTLSATGSPTLLPAAWPYPKAWNPVVVLEEDAVQGIIMDGHGALVLMIEVIARRFMTWVWLR